MVCITDFVEWYKSMTFSPFLSKGVIMRELLFCSNGTLFCGVPCFRLIMVFIVMDDTFHFLCYLGLVMIQGKWCHYSAFFFLSILLYGEECLEYIKLTVVFWNWNSSRLANPQEAKIFRFLSPASDSFQEPNLQTNVIRIMANLNYLDWMNWFRSWSLLELN